MTLHVASTHEDGAFHVYLEDVAPDGRITYITEGILRAIHHKLSDEAPIYNLPGPYRTYKSEVHILLLRSIKHVFVLVFITLFPCYITNVCAQETQQLIISERHGISQITMTDQYTNRLHLLGIASPQLEDQEENESSWDSGEMAKEIGAGMAGGLVAMLSLRFSGEAWNSPSKAPVTWIIAPLFATTVSVYLAGADDRESYSGTNFSAPAGEFLLTLAGGTLGFGLPLGIAKLCGLELDSGSRKAIVSTYISAVICASVGATIGFNLASSDDSDDQPNSALAPMYLNLLEAQF